MRKALIIFSAWLFVFCPVLNAAPPFEEGVQRVNQMEESLAGLKEAVQDADEARSMALATSFGQLFLKVETFSVELRSQGEMGRLALLEDRIRQMVAANLSLLLAVREGANREAQIGIDRAFSVYLNGMENARTAVASAVARELQAAQ